MSKLNELNKLVHNNFSFAGELEALNEKTSRQAVGQTIALAEEFGLNLTEQDFDIEELSIDDFDLVSGGIAKRERRKTRIKP